MKEFLDYIQQERIFQIQQNTTICLVKMNVELTRLNLWKTASARDAKVILIFATANLVFECTTEHFTHGWLSILSVECNF